ncbi:glycosyltransferase [Pedobacter heparinus]|uniref:glycosyltransferase n=1 Tax=Pedobacter heparinus TaxID=984 RepID=UPI00292EC257|nr:glycosyltransferase [Pedobacter heparinus]
MKRKVFFVMTALKDGGSERVFWLLCQGFNKNLYDVSLVLLDPDKTLFSRDLPGVNFIDLGTRKASRSFFQMYKLFKKEKPFAVFSTTDHINILVSFVSLFVKIPKLIARASNNPHQMKKYEGFKGRFWALFTRFSYRKYQVIVCQTREMKRSILSEYRLDPNRLVVIPNPVLYTSTVKELNKGFKIPVRKKILVIARLSKEKGLERLLDIFSRLPGTYTLNIAGDGPLKEAILEKIASLKLSKRVNLLGSISNVISILPEYDSLVLSSLTEGFPNVILESLSVGIPVVSFRVGGVNSLLKDGFNGYIVEQDDLDAFRARIITTCNQAWDFAAIKADVFSKYALDKVVPEYECLLD